MNTDKPILWRLQQTLPLFYQCDNLVLKGGNSFVINKELVRIDFNIEITASECLGNRIL